MVYRGTVRGGMVVLQPGVHLPDGLDVAVVPVQAKSFADSRSLAMKNGVPFFPQQGTEAANLELVNKLRDDAP